MTITNFCFTKDTPASTFYEYIVKNDDMVEYLKNDTITFKHYKYTAYAKLEGSCLKTTIYESNNTSYVFNDSISIENNDDNLSEEEKFVELAKTEPKKALAEAVDTIFDITKTDKSSANVELAIKLFISYYTVAIISEQTKNISKVAVEVINGMGQNGLKYIKKLVSIILKGIHEINKDMLDDDGKTLYDLIDNEFVKKLDQQTS